jgi:hypothetical protein
MTLRIVKEITEIEIEKKGIALGREIEGEISFEIERKEVKIVGRIEMKITEVLVMVRIEVDTKPFA